MCHGTETTTHGSAKPPTTSLSPTARLALAPTSSSGTQVRALTPCSLTDGGPMDGYYAWMLVATALVLMMTTPALALFYGGMSRSKSVLNMMMMSYVAMGVVGLVYVLWGWSMSFGGKEVLGGLFSDPFELFGLEGVGWDSYIAVMFQMTFAAITAALISGAVADRVKLSSWIVFLPLWITLVYFPLA